MDGARTARLHASTLLCMKTLSGVGVTPSRNRFILSEVEG
jgi:hypothetical protein